jgi:Tol biopolymer transport system component
MRSRTLFRLHAAVVIGSLAATAVAAPAPTMQQLSGYSYVSGLAASEKGDKFAWVEDVAGVRNIWSASTADSKPRQLTHYTTDDGQELTQLTFSPDGSELLFVRGGDHDENWPAKGNLAPNPDNGPAEPKVTIWSVAVTDSTPTPVQVAERR